MDEEKVRPSIASYDALEIVAGCAALQLDRRNADNADHLSSLAAAAQHEAAGAENPDWETLLPAVAHFHRTFRWDPHETVWVEPLGFIGGPFLLFTDGSPESVFGLSKTLQAIFMGEGVGDAQTKRHLLDLCLAVLRLSDHLVKEAGAVRYMPAEHRSDSGVFFPDLEEFDRLRNVVSFSAAEIENTTGKRLEVLAPLVRDLDVDGPIPNSEQTGAPLTALFPILKRDERYVVVSPAGLASGLRHRLVVELLAAGKREELVRRLWMAVLADVARSLNRMGWEFGASKDPAEGESIGQAAFLFDDKAAVVTVLIDDFGDYEIDDPDGMWNAMRFSDQVEAAMIEGEEATFFGPPPRPNDLIHLVVFAGVGRGMMFGLRGEVELAEAPRLLLSPEALAIISYSGVDHLELWKFAKAQNRLRDEADVMFASMLDEYAAWREMHRSFYFGDEGRPTAVHFDPSYGRAFREKVGIQRDVHAVANSGSITEVIRLAEDPRIPVYIPILDLYEASDGVPRLLVEHQGTQIWVKADLRAAGEDKRAYAQIVDCIAFWLWQLAPAFPSLRQKRIDLEVLLENPGVWRSAAEVEDDGPVADIELIHDNLRVTVFPQMVPRLNQPDNNAERELAATLLRGIHELAAANVGESLVERQIAAAIEQYAPLGPKKKINLITDVNDAALLDGPLPPARYVQDPDAEPILDSAGRLAVEELGLAVGSIPDDKRNKILNAIVAHHLEELRALIATLSPDGLLEYLIDNHEALLHHRAISQIKYPSEAAAYGEGQQLEQLRKEIPRSANAGVALRFLIEYVAACPPRGVRPISLDLFDQLLALASQIANRGWTSDIVKYGLGQRLELSILESGRLGIKREETYFTGQEAYLDARVPSVADIALRSYRSHWGERKHVSEELIDRLDIAAKAEWGVSMRELGQLYGELENVAFRRQGAATAVPRSKLIAELFQELGFAQEVVERGLELLTLEPRDDFLSVPPPFELPDLYPWRYNRELSYMRRPLILRKGRGEPAIIWGPRHVEAAGHYLLDLVTSERLKARSNEMKTLMTELRQEETAAFVDEVAKRLEGAAMVVDRNVKKIGGKRITRRNGKDLAGDLDILAADKQRKVLHVRECKDLEGARTPAELSNELRHNFAVAGDKRSAADRHLERIAWVEQHLDATLEHLGVVPAKDWRVVGGFVVDVEVLSPYVSDCPLPITPIDRLLEELGVA